MSRREEAHVERVEHVQGLGDMPPPVRIDGLATTYVFASFDGGLPSIVYCGRTLPADTDLAAFAASRVRPLPHATLDVIPPVTLSPEPRRGFMGHPGLVAHREAGQQGLLEPVQTQTQVEPHAVTFVTVDRTRKFRLASTCTIDTETDVAVFRSLIVNEGDDELDVEWLAAPALAVPPQMTQRLRFGGRWCAEFDAVRQPIRRGFSADENRRGRTSHETFPGTVLLSPATGENHGQALAVHLAWSGNHRLILERLAEGVVQLQAGTLDMGGETRLAPGESIASPDLYLARSDEGLSGASHKLHTHVRRRLLRLPDPSRPRPVTVNTWEAIYFDHDIPKLKHLADRAAAIGAERFVLDDGWFGRGDKRRDDDTSSLGDWYVDERKYPNGLGEIVDYVTGKGMEFGLWVEPEMVNADSQLFREHPEWTLGIDPHELTAEGLVTGRRQLVLDLTQDAVRDYLFERLSHYLATYRIGYLKWDMNRNLVLPADRTGRPAARRQVENLYRLIDDLREAFPHVEIESCASGGARIDYAILRRTHRFWASDSNDPVERTRIQMGFSHFLPPEVMGAHVGPDWCHTTGRGTRLAFRTLVASWGHMGLELDLTSLSDEQLDFCARAVALHKADRPIWHNGRLHRLDHPDENLFAVMGVGEGRASARLVVTQLDRPRDTIPLPLMLHGLSEDRDYRITLQTPRDVAMMGNLGFDNPLFGDGLVLSGRVLREAGLQLPVMYAQTGLAIALEAVQ